MLQPIPQKLHTKKEEKLNNFQNYKSFKNADDWYKRFEKCIKQDIIDNIPKGLCACIYTQLSDVEDELNGFVTFDREVIKVDPNKIKFLNDKIKFEV